MMRTSSGVRPTYVSPAGAISIDRWDEGTEWPADRLEVGRLGNSGGALARLAMGVRLRRGDASGLPSPAGALAALPGGGEEGGCGRTPCREGRMGGNLWESEDPPPPYALAGAVPLPTGASKSAKPLLDRPACAREESRQSHECKPVKTTTKPGNSLATYDTASASGADAAINDSSRIRASIDQMLICLEH